MEPSGELARLHRAVLGGDQSLNLPGGKRARIQVQGSPAQLPAAKPGFTGRRDASAQLEALLCASGGAGRRGDAKPRLASLHGMPGVGKSALAIHTAQRLRSHFPDGQLYVDLREAGGRPGSPAEAVAGFLRAAGTRPPQRLEARCELFRQWSAHRRLLVVLDNVESAEQVLPLLPAGPECATILTSRSHLAGLGEVAALELALPSTDEAVQLLASLVGQERTEREPAQAERIVRLCGALPAAPARRRLPDQRRARHPAGDGRAAVRRGRQAGCADLARRGPSGELRAQLPAAGAERPPDVRPAGLAAGRRLHPRRPRGRRRRRRRGT
ncbi:hypothetical protein GCM10020000_67230 [Streptomyces olivoverticillatus]